jgi:hypothetical protein
MHHRTLAGLWACAFAVLLAVGSAQAQELLTNGNLDDPGDHESDIATAWTLTETIQSGGAVNSATFASFANHTPPAGDPTQVGLWYRSFAGTDTDTVAAHLTQTVAGTPGSPYFMSGWARFEANYPGGVAGDQTDTVFALEFLDAGNNVLAGSQTLELLAAGQANDGVWRQHFLSGVAPAGTANVRVRSSMLNGHVVPANPQSAFVDDFSLTIPEPASLGLVSFAAVALLGRRRRIA